MLLLFSPTMHNKHKGLTLLSNSQNPGLPEPEPDPNGFFSSLILVQKETPSIMTHRLCDFLTRVQFYFHFVLFFVFPFFLWSRKCNSCWLTMTNNYHSDVKCKWASISIATRKSVKISELISLNNAGCSFYNLIARA